MEKDQNIELANGGILLREAGLRTSEPSIEDLDDISLIWGAALYRIRNNSVKDGLGNDRAWLKGRDISTEPPYSTDPETISLTQDYDGAWRDTYRTLTISPTSPISFRFQNIHWNGDEELDQDITWSSEEEETLAQVKAFANRLREDPETMVDDSVFKLRSESEQPVFGQTEAGIEIKTQVLDWLNGATTIALSEYLWLEKEVDSIIGEMGESLADMKPTKAQKKIIKNLLKRLHPDVNTGGDELFKKVSEHRDKTDWRKKDEQ